MTPPEPRWWGPADEEILRGELAKLADLPRPSIAGPPTQLIPGAPATTYRTSRFRRFWVRHPIAARILLMLPLLAVVLLIGAMAAAHSGDGTPYRIPDSGYPTTYGPPGPRGGPQ